MRRGQRVLTYRLANSFSFIYFCFFCKTDEYSHIFSAWTGYITFSNRFIKTNKENHNLVARVFPWRWEEAPQRKALGTRLRKSQPGRRLGCAVLISSDFDDFTYPSVYSLVFISIDKIYQKTRDSGSSAIQTPRILSKTGDHESLRVRFNQNLTIQYLVT